MSTYTVGTYNYNPTSPLPVFPANLLLFKVRKKKKKSYTQGFSPAKTLITNSSAKNNNEAVRSLGLCLLISVVKGILTP